MGGIAMDFPPSQGRVFMSNKFDQAFSLTGKVAVVTGGAAGIGLAVAELFAAKGASLVLVDLNPAVADVAKSLPGKHLAITADVTKTSEIQEITGKAMAEFGHIDILVNNAGVAFLEEAELLSEADWDKTMAVNLKAPFMLAQSVGREMIKQKSGRIVNLASQAGVIALDRHVAYCSSKAAIIGMTKVLAMEWAEFGITVNAVSPTVVETELGKKAWAGEVGAAMKKKIPTGRFAQPDEIASLILYLVSGVSGMITGENVIIDGGYTVI